MVKEKGRKSKEGSPATQHGGEDSINDPRAPEGTQTRAKPQKKHVAGTPTPNPPLDVQNSTPGARTMITRRRSGQNTAIPSIDPTTTLNTKAKPKTNAKESATGSEALSAIATLPTNTPTGKVNAKVKSSSAQAKSTYIDKTANARLAATENNAKVKGDAKSRLSSKQPDVDTDDVPSNVTNTTTAQPPAKALPKTRKRANGGEKGDEVDETTNKAPKGKRKKIVNTADIDPSISGPNPNTTPLTKTPSAEALSKFSEPASSKPKSAPKDPAQAKSKEPTRNPIRDRKSTRLNSSHLA